MSLFRELHGQGIYKLLFLGSCCTNSKLLACIFQHRNCQFAQGALCHMVFQLFLRHLNFWLLFSTTTRFSCAKRMKQFKILSVSSFKVSESSGNSSKTKNVVKIFWILPVSGSQYTEVIHSFPMHNELCCSVFAPAVFHSVIINQACYQKLIKLRSLLNLFSPIYYDYIITIINYKL